MLDEVAARQSGAKNECAFMFEKYIERKKPSHLSVRGIAVLEMIDCRIQESTTNTMYIYKTFVNCYMPLLAAITIINPQGLPKRDSPLG
jgi:hypothetical protein